MTSQAGKLNLLIKQNIDMKRKLFSLLFGISLLILSSCNNNSQLSKTETNIQKSSLEQAYHFSDSIYAVCGRIDTAAFGDFIRQAVSFVESNPNDSISPSMFYKAGVGSMILAKSAKTPEFRAENAKNGIYIFNKYQELYPNDPNFRYCYWQRAIIYDYILGDWRSAESEYRDFITRFPNDSLTPIFQQYIQLLGKSETQIEEQLGIK